MASVVQPHYSHRRASDTDATFTSFFHGGVKISLGGVWAGVLIAVGLLVLLASLGAAVGVSAVQPGETEASTLGIGAGIWAGISLLLSLFLGGLVSTRTGAITDGATGFFEGALVWIVSILLAGYLATSGIGALAGGAFKLVGGAGQAIGSAMQSQGGAQGGQIADQAAQAAQQAKQRVQQAQQSGELQQKAEEAKPAATKAAWITFAALILSLACALIGAMIGRRNMPAQSGRSQPHNIPG